jgi:hypothetical protein
MLLQETGCRSLQQNSRQKKVAPANRRSNEIESNAALLFLVIDRQLRINSCFSLPDLQQRANPPVSQCCLIQIALLDHFLFYIFLNFVGDPTIHPNVARAKILHKKISGSVHLGSFGLPTDDLQGDSGMYNFDFCKGFQLVGHAPFSPLPRAQETKEVLEQTFTGNRSDVPCINAFT